MSKKRKITHCFVIDADIARAAGSLESENPRGRTCRDFLMAVRGICHRLAWSAAIRDEWDKHHSKFATDWLASMTRLNKVRHLGAIHMALLEEIGVACRDEAIAAIVRKDCHLIEAALATDSRVASLDETVRGHLARLASAIECLRQILWVNPTNEDEEALEWLEQGAPAQKKRYLRL